MAYESGDVNNGTGMFCLERKMAKFVVGKV